jgi:hypothetical protein
MQAGWLRGALLCDNLASREGVVSFSSLHSNTLGEHAAVAPFVSTAP